MAGGFSAGGLITGIDSNALIRQLLQIERQPIVRLEQRIETLESRRDAISELRTQLLSLRNLIQDFRITSIFDQFKTVSSDEGVATATVSGANPTSGAFTVEVLQLASATVASSNGRLGAAIDPNAALSSTNINTAVTAGSFSINGVSFNVDPTTQSLNDVLNQINASSAGVTATYDSATDTVTFANSTAGDTSFINFEASSDTSNFLSAINVTNATQSTNVNGSTELNSTRNLGAVNPGAVLNQVSFAGGAVTGGSFSINGIQITVDPTTDSLTDVLNRINSSDADVTASYDSTTDTIRVVSDQLGSRTINFASGTSNFLDVTNLTTATQAAGNDAQFTVNGGPVQTRNSNEITDALNDLTLTLTGVGTTTISVSSDEDSVVEKVREFVEKFNESLTSIQELIGEDGDLENDATIRQIESTLHSTIFQRVTGISGNFNSLLNVGISTGDSFDPSAPFQLVLDETELQNALLEDKTNVANLFSNDDETGILDQIFPYLDSITESGGALHERSRPNGSIDSQIRTLNDRIDAIERRVQQREIRLRQQFANLEQIVNTFQAQGASLNSLAGGFGTFF